MEYLKIKADQAKTEEIMAYYGAEKITDPRRKYDLFQTVSEDGVQIKGYASSNPDLFTILFFGEDTLAENEARIFFKELPVPIKERPQDEKWEDKNSQIGTDEVGVGDFFQGFYIVASYLTSADVDYIDSLGVMDSKKLTDSRIEEIAPSLMKKIKHFSVRISPDKLCEYKAKKWSTHKILANAHNYAQQALKDKYHLPSSLPVYIDQFEKEEIYRHYVGKDIISNPLVFRTKGETYYPSVATSSVIARYLFLQDWKAMEAKLGSIVPKGADDLVDKKYKSLVRQYGKEALDPYVKRFFKNYIEDNK
jgi:ribonuclease HIII